MGTIAENLQAVHERIARAAAAAGRSANDIELVAVSKTLPAASVEAAYRCGQRHFGENQAQEGVEKVTALAALPGLTWHFIGPIQGNKTRAVAEHFHWVHGLDRERIATRLAAARPAALAPLQVCIQVNVSGEASKSGVAPGGELALAETIARLPRLALRGLMAIPAPHAGEAAQRRQFALLRRLKEALNVRGHALDTLSMGMSADLEAAVAEGATMVRVGTAIFGARRR
ncbi:MAG: YggS family pyridoxal phosphate-dependent enzyme [Burkholderiales bacterium]|nr:YggS family pyridoxal phosphate-dependent enzyme [Burkholderiales bacterium]